MACIETGARVETYVVERPGRSGVICINGAAARLCSPGDMIIILQFVLVEPTLGNPGLSWS